MNDRNPINWAIPPDWNGDLDALADWALKQVPKKQVARAQWEQWYAPGSRLSPDRVDHTAEVEKLKRLLNP